MSERLRNQKRFARGGMQLCPFFSGPIVRLEIKRIPMPLTTDARTAQFIQGFRIASRLRAGSPIPC